MNKLIDGLFIVVIVSILGIAIAVGLFAREIYQRSKAQDTCPTPVNQIPTEFEPQMPIGREI